MNEQEKSDKVGEIAAERDHWRNIAGRLDDRLTEDAKLVEGVLQKLTIENANLRITMGKVEALTDVGEDPEHVTSADIHEALAPEGNEPR